MGNEQGGEVSALYPLPLKPLDSVRDDILPAGPDAAEEEPAAQASPEDSGLANEECAAAVATAVAEKLAAEPNAPLVESVHVVLRASSEAPKSQSILTTRSATARSREPTPISMIH